MRSFAPLALLTAIGGLSLGGCMTGPGLDLTPRRAPAFVAVAASSDMYQIESSRLALQRSRDPMVRMHAEMMIRDHANTSARLRSAAATVGLGVAVQMLPIHQNMLNALRGSADFDASYRQQQRLSHEQALRLHITYSRFGDVPQLQGVAAAAVPIVRGHLDHLRM